MAKLDLFKQERLLSYRKEHTGVKQHTDFEQGGVSWKDHTWATPNIVIYQDATLDRHGYNCYFTLPYSGSTCTQPCYFTACSFQRTRHQRLDCRP